MVLLQELPEQVYLHPPLSIFVVEKRAFGRTVLAGTHIVSDVMKFSPRELEEEPEYVLKGELLGEVPMEAAGRFCQWQRSVAVPLPTSQAAKPSPKIHKMPRKSTAWGRVGLEAGCDPGL